VKLAEKSMSDERRPSSFSLTSKPKLHNGSVIERCSFLSDLNQPLLLNADDRPNILVPETVPDNFPDYDEVQCQPVENACDSSVSRTEDECSPPSVKQCSHIAGQVKSGSPNVQPTIVTSCSEKASPGSPVFNRQCHFAVPLPVNSSPSLFDEEEEKQSRQRTVGVGRFFDSNMKPASGASRISTDVSPSVLNRQQCVAAAGQQDIDETNGDDCQQKFQSLLPCAVNKRLVVKAEIKSNCKDSIVQLKASGAHTTDEVMLPSELKIPLNGLDDAETLYVDKISAKHSRDIDTLSLNGEVRDDLSECVHSSAACELQLHEPPLPKRRRCEAVSGSIVLLDSPQSLNTDNDVEDGKFIFPSTFFLTLYYERLSLSALCNTFSITVILSKQS